MYSKAYQLEEELQGSREWGERRGSKRYKLALQLRYMAVCNEVLRVGYGVTLDISGKSVLFHPDAHLVPDTRVELSVCWPATRSGEPLRLLLYGSVMLSNERGVAALIERYNLVPEVSHRYSGAAPEWDKVLERLRCKLLKMGRSVNPRRKGKEDAEFPTECHTEPR